MGSLTIASLNCQGLGDMRKRRDVFHYLKQKKYSIYCLQDTHFNTKLEKYVSNEWGYKCFFSSYQSNARGVAVMFANNFEFKIKSVKRDDNGNLIIISFSAMEKDFLLVNVYGPNKDDPNFYVNLKEIIKNYNNNNIIAVGDWNVAMDPNIDCDNYIHINNPKAREEIEKMTRDLGLADIWREDNPECRRYTWRKKNPLKQSRLDYFLLSDYLFWYFESTDILPGYRSDHSMVTLTLSFGEKINVKTFWKFNSSLLKDIKYVEEINAEIKIVLKEYAADHYAEKDIENIDNSEIELKLSDKVFLDFLLMKIRSKTIAYASMKNKQAREIENKLIKEIEILEQLEIKSQNEIKLLQDKQNELEKFRNHRMEGVLLRSKAQWIEDGEKISKYFCNLEKRNYVSKHMSNMINEDGNILTDQKDIKEHVKNFYEALYKEQKNEEKKVEDLIKHIPKISEDEKEILKGKITLEEAGYALYNMKNGKSPGTDGFTVDFFKFFWNQLGIFVVRSLNRAYEDGELSSTQKEGLITCIPKKDKPRELIKNWRPISLLNVVYKIGSACIANRIKTVLPTLISEDQTGFMSNRYMGDNIRLIYDVINYLKSKNIPGLLLCIDFEKAFDSLSWNFLFKVLEAYGFTENICRWIETFLTNIKSTIVVNGNTTEWFKIERGCRQGDPISPYLFILCAEILSIMIKEDDMIKGIFIGETQYKISQYADDTQLLSAGDKQSFERTLHILEIFGKNSGLHMNNDKTQAVWLGSKRKSKTKYRPDLNIIWNPTKFKILGIWLTENLDECDHINYNDKFAEINMLFKIWSKRCLTPIGRVAILKSLILSKLVHLWLLLPNPPNYFIENLQKMCFQFVWNGKTDKISRKVSTKPVKEGGIGVPDIKMYIFALKISWIRKINNTEHNWKSVAKTIFPSLNKIECYGPSYFLENKRNRNRFWIDVFIAYKTLCSKITPCNENELLKEPVFYNENITIGKKIIKQEKLIEKGIYCIKHFLNRDGQFLSYNNFVDKLGSNIAGTIDFVTFNGWIASIKQFIKGTGLKIDSNANDDIDKPSGLKIIESVPKGAKTYYEQLIKNETKPNCCQKWTNKLNSNIPWKAVFLKIHKIKDVSLKWLQIRITHRIVVTNVILNSMGVSDTTKCTWCDDAKDSVLHFLWNCKHVSSFWTSLEKLFTEKCINACNFKISRNIVLFGTDHNIKTDEIVDLIVLLAKQYILKCKVEKCIPYIVPFKNILNYRFKIEMYNATINNNKVKCLNAWINYKPMFTESL